MIRYDPDWRADGQPDRRKYPNYLIILFWGAVVISILSFLTTLTFAILSYTELSASSIVALAAGLGTIAWIGNKSEKTSMR